MFSFLKFFYRFIRWDSIASTRVTDCKGSKHCSMDLTTMVVVMLPEVQVAKAEDNKVQVLSDNIEVAGHKVAFEVESCKELLQFSGAKLFCAVVMMERLGICYKCYDILKLERLIAGNNQYKRFSSTTKTCNKIVNFTKIS